MSFNVAHELIPEVRRSKDFVADAAKFILEHARKAIAERGLFRIALSGGNTPRLIHAKLAEIAGDLEWGKVQITFGDERCVPPDDKDSNYRMARESLLDVVGIPEGNVFRIRGEIDPETAARECESKLAAVAGRFGEARYVHDLILLGLGEDGHTASLFPGSPALAERGRNVIPATGPKPPPQRVTFTFPLLNAARHVCFLVQSTPAKEQVLREAIAGDERHPAARVRPVNGGLTWLIGE
jgi:6-phosphogluconolactonase